MTEGFTDKEMRALLDRACTLAREVRAKQPPLLPQTDEPRYTAEEILHAGTQAGISPSALEIALRERSLSASDEELLERALSTKRPIDLALDRFHSYTASVLCSLAASVQPAGLTIARDSRYLHDKDGLKQAIAYQHRLLFASPRALTFRQISIPLPDRTEGIVRVALPLTMWVRDGKEENQKPYTLFIQSLTPRFTALIEPELQTLRSEERLGYFDFKQFYRRT